MPTWKGMLDTRRVVVCCLVVLAPQFALSVAGAATTTTTSAPTTTTTVPIGRSGATDPPPTTPTPTTIPAAPTPFTLPTDFGLQLVLAQNQAKQDLAVAQLQLPGARKDRDAAKKEDLRAKEQLKTLTASARAAEAKLDATRRHLRVVAAQAYIHANGGEIEAAISSLLNAKSAVEVASQLHIISKYGSNEKDALAEYLSLKERVDRQVAVISDLRDRTSRRLKSAQQHLADVHTTITNASKKISDTLLGIAKFQAAATSASSPILGPSRLTANQMADYLMSQGAHTKDRKSTRLNSSHSRASRMPSSA